MNELKIIEIAEKYENLDKMPQNLVDLTILHAYDYYIDRLTREQFFGTETTQNTNTRDTTSVDAAIQKLIDEME